MACNLISPYGSMLVVCSWCAIAVTKKWICWSLMLYHALVSFPLNAAKLWLGTRLRKPIQAVEIPHNHCNFRVLMALAFAFLHFPHALANSDGHSSGNINLLPGNLSGSTNFYRNESSANSPVGGFGSDTRTNRSWFPTYEVEGKYSVAGISVGLINLKLREKGKDIEVYSHCTGTLISELYVITNHHCIPSDEDKYEVLEASILFGYYFKEGEDEALEYELLTLVEEANEDLDYAIVRLARNRNTMVKPVEFRVREPLGNEPVYMIHHPRRLPQVVSHNLGTCRIDYRRTASRTLYHRCETDHGSSGALLIADSDGAVLGIHRGARLQKVVNPQSRNLATSMHVVVENSSLLQSLSVERTKTEASRSKRVSKRVEISAQAESDRHFSSRYETYEKMELAACKSAESRAIVKLREECSQTDQPSLASYNRLSCTVVSGKRVRIYGVKMKGTCSN